MNNSGQILPQNALPFLCARRARTCRLFGNLDMQLEESFALAQLESREFFLNHLKSSSTAGEIRRVLTRCASCCSSFLCFGRRGARPAVRSSRTQSESSSATSRAFFVCIPVGAQHGNRQQQRQQQEQVSSHNSAEPEIKYRCAVWAGSVRAANRRHNRCYT